MKKAINLSLITLFLLFIGTALHAQKDKSQRPSPPVIVEKTIADLSITIDYSSPSVKGREIWGELVK